MNIVIKNARVIDPHSALDRKLDVYIEQSMIVAMPEQGVTPHGIAFKVDQELDAEGLIVCPGLVDLTARLKEPGYEHEGMLDSELRACVAGGITSLVCPPDTDPVLDEPGLVDMLRYKAGKLELSRVFPLAALTKGLLGESLTEMVELTQAGSIGFGQAEHALNNTQVLLRAMQYAATYGYCVWLRPQDYYLGQGVAASGPLATRLGLSGVPVAAETIALNTIFALVRSTGARVHLSRLSSAPGVALVKAAKEEGLRFTCDVSINSLHLSDQDIGYFDSRARLTPPLRQLEDKQALQKALASGVIDALVSDHNPVEGDLKELPFAQAEAGASGAEFLLSLALKWGDEQGLDLMESLRVVTSKPGEIIQSSLACSEAQAPNIKGSAPAFHAGRIVLGGLADLCIFDPSEHWMVEPKKLVSQGKYTPFDFEMSGSSMHGRVVHTLVGGKLVYSKSQ
jgi:dihydroorotase